MKRIGLVLIGLVAAAMGLADTKPDVWVEFHGLPARGSVIPFSVMIGDKVDDLGELRVGLYTGVRSIFFTETRYHPVHPGSLIAKLNPSDDADPNGSYTGPPYLGFVSGFTAGFKFDLAAGPGEVMQGRVVFPFDDTEPTGDYTLNLTIDTAKDSRGNKLNLLADTRKFHFENRLWGDLNNDGKLDLKDVTMALQAAIHLRTLDPVQAWYADVSPTSLDGSLLPSGRLLGDGKVDMGDVTTLLRLALGYWRYWFPDALPR